MVCNSENIKIIENKAGWNSSFPVFHGTSSYFSEQIENNGFEHRYSPYDRDKLTEFVNEVKAEDIDDEVTKNCNELIAYANKPTRLSFAGNYEKAKIYAENFPGGQIAYFLRVFREKKFVIPIEFEEIIDHCEKSSKCIYVCIKSDIEDYTKQENGLLFAEKNIPPQLISYKLTL